MINGPKLTPTQWKYLANGISNISQAIIIFSLAAIFVPETVNLSIIFTKIKAFGYLFCGIILFGFGAIISKKDKDKNG